MKRKRGVGSLTDWKCESEKRVLTDRLISPIRSGPAPRLLKVTRLHPVPPRPIPIISESFPVPILSSSNLSLLRPPQIHRSQSAQCPLSMHSLHSTGFNNESPAKAQEFHVSQTAQVHSPFSHSNTSVLNYRIFKSPPKVLVSDRSNENLGP